MLQYREASNESKGGGDGDVDDGSVQKLISWSENFSKKFASNKNFFFKKNVFPTLPRSALHRKTRQQQCDQIGQCLIIFQSGGISLNLVTLIFNPICWIYAMYT